MKIIKTHTNFPLTLGYICLGTALIFSGCDFSVSETNNKSIKETKENSTIETRKIQNTETGKVQNYDVRKARMVQEYYLVNNLVSQNITNETVDSGDWSDPTIWKDGKIPQDGARVLINKDHKVTINKTLTTKIRTIKLDGTLAFNPHQNTQLVVDTMVTSSGSTLRIGRPKVPVDANKSATIVISDYNEEGMITDNPDSIDYDPLRIGQGILTNGLFFAYGSYKTPYREIKGSGVEKGDRVVEIEKAVTGWKVGDKVIVLGTSEEGNQSEIRTITEITDSAITLDRELDYDHIVPDTTLDRVRPKLKVHIANLTRNIVIKTDPEVLEGKGDKNDPNNVEHRGHVLFMHNNNVNLKSVEFRDLGRTNKKYVLDETEFESEDANATVTKIGTNQAARYPVHFHRAGLDGKIGRIRDCVVFKSPGWGYVNHSSNVIMRNNIAYGVYGSSFITEAGDENGKFIRNMAIETRGYGRSSVKGWSARTKNDDWGFGGNGFWLLGPNVDVIGNIVNGSSNSAFAFTRKTIDSVTGVINPEDNTETTYSKVPLKSFMRNIAYANSGGVFGILSGTRGGTTEQIKGLLAYANGPFFRPDKNNPDYISDHNKEYGELISWWYPSNVYFENTILIGDIYNPRYLAIGTQTKLRKTTIKNSKIEGFNVGLRIPEYVGLNTIEDIYLNNKINMLYYLGTTNKGANTIIKGRVRYGKLPNENNQTNIMFGLKVRDVDWKNYQDRQYKSYSIIYAPDGEVPLKLYATVQQSPDFVIEVGDQEGKTNQELVDNGHSPVGGAMIPDDAFELENSYNVSASPVEE